MSTTADYLAELIAQRNALARNLTAQGVAAAQSERFNTLVPKVLELPCNAVAGEWTPPEDTMEMTITDSMPFTPSVFSVNGLSGSMDMYAPVSPTAYLMNGGYDANGFPHTGHFVLSCVKDSSLVLLDAFLSDSQPEVSVYEGGFSIRNWAVPQLNGSLNATFRGGVTYQWLARP